MNAPQSPAGELSRQQKMFTLVGTLLGMFLAALDQTIVSTAGPAMQRELHIEPGLYAWITTAYLITSTVMVPIYGKLSDALGRKRVLVAGIGVFLAGSLLCGVAQDTLQLILFRGVQGLGSAALFTSAFAVVADLFPPAERGKYQGIFGAAFGLSSVVGPLLGGFITDHFGWHWVFFVNLPIGALALAFILTRMPPLRRPGAQLRLDVAGVLSLVLFAVPLLLALSLRQPGLRAGLLAASVVGLVLFIAAERRAADPLLDLALFSDRVFTTANLATFFTGATFLASIVFLPLFMVNVVGLSAQSSGLTMTPLTVGIISGNVVSGQLVSRSGRYKPVILGSLLLLCGAFVLMALTLTPASTQWEVSWKMVLVGLGLGPTIPLYTLAIQNAVPVTRLGVATGAATFFRSMGSTLGVAVLGTVFGVSLSGAMQARMAEATQGLPEALVAQLAPGGVAGSAGEEGARPARGVDVTKLKAQVEANFAARRTEAGDDPEVLGVLRKQEALTLERLDKVGAAVKAAYAESVARIYLYALALAVVALFATLAIPSVPLRRGGAPGAAPPPVE